MTLFGSNGAGFKQVFPMMDYEVQVSQRLVDASHKDDLKAACDCLGDPFLNVNFIGTVSLKAKKAEFVLQDELAHQVDVDYEEFKTEVTSLFLAAHNGNFTLVRKLLSLGANVNQKLFRGYATTAAVREGHLEILELLIKAGACQGACEEALLEASYLGKARPAELLMGSDLIRPQVAVHALVSACCRGFVDVVNLLIKCGIDANAIDRVLLRSSKPSLHTNFDCSALAAAVVSRQSSVVQVLLQADVRMDIKLNLGAWSWDMETGEEFRVGAGLAEPYSVAWCAVEYFEASGSILRMLLQHTSPNSTHNGRTLLHHAILCNNPRAVDVLLNCNAGIEFTTSKHALRPIHLAVRLGLPKVLERLIVHGCDVNSRTNSGETAIMICVRYKQEECLKALASAGADFGLVSLDGQSANSISKSTGWNRRFQKTILDTIREGIIIKSCNCTVFSSLMFVIRANDVEALISLIKRSDIDLDEQDEDGFSAAMVAAAGGHVEAFRLLLHAGANIKLRNKHGETAISLSESNHYGEVIEKIILEYSIEMGNNPSVGFYTLHRAARGGDRELVSMLITRGHDINAFDGDGYTPLMLAARGGHGGVCEHLISCGARCDKMNARNETALLLAKKSGYSNHHAESVILDELARKLVLGGTRVKKHTRSGKGSPHYKELKMVENRGVLRWGKSRKRNVICKSAEVGANDKFRWNRRKKFDGDEPGVFHVVTTKEKVVHFVCEGGFEMALLWVRGIRLLTNEALL